MYCTLVVLLNNNNYTLSKHDSNIYLLLSSYRQQKKTSKKSNVLKTFKKSKINERLKNILNISFKNIYEYYNRYRYLLYS